MSNRRIVIVGFMGCGKTAVAKELSRQLDSKFIDLDSFITERNGRSPAEIIQQDGETLFREIETLALRDVLQDRKASSIALGGGTWTIPANRTLVALHDCLSIWLDVPFEVCWHRIMTSSKTVRPLAPDRDTPPLWIDTGSEQLVIPLASFDAVKRAAPNPQALQVRGSNGTRAMAYVFAREGDHVLARFFFPKHGAVIEDPGTGSACANLGGWLLVTGAKLPQRVSIEWTMAVGPQPSRRSRASAYSATRDPPRRLCSWATRTPNTGSARSIALVGSGAGR